MQQYYDFYRQYTVAAHNFKEARVKFSRALEEGVEDQYYVGTTFGFPTQKTETNGVGAKLLRLLPWFWDEARNQIFGYPKYNR